MTRLLAILVLAGLLAGCGYYRWEKPGATSADFQRDSDECQRIAAQGQWSACMTGKGWHYTDRYF